MLFDFSYHGKGLVLLLLATVKVLPLASALGLALCAAYISCVFARILGFYKVLIFVN